MPFLALFKLLSLKEWLVIAALLALFFGGVWLYRHGEHRIEAQDARITKAAQETDKRVAAAAQVTETQSAIIYKQAVAIPAVADIGIVCHAPSRSVVPPAVPGAAATTNNATADGGSGPTFDPSGAILTRAAQADAQIEYLQRRIKELETEMNGAP